jgi:hypothetical protein
VKYRPAFATGASVVDVVVDVEVDAEVVVAKASDALRSDVVGA